MDLPEFNSGAGAPATKPWLTPVVYSLECQSATVHGRITQQSVLPTPYAAWASLDSFTLTASGVSTNAMGSFAGAASIPAAALYPGASFRVRVGGSITTAAANNVILSIRNFDGSYTYASVTLAIPGAMAATPFTSEFNIQVNALGGPGVGSMRSTSYADVGAGTVSQVFNIVDGAGFDSTGGIGLYLYISNSVAGNSVTRTIGYCDSVY